jgi:HEAT repeat protein
LLAAAFAAALLSQAPIDPLVEALRRPALADRARLYVMELVRERPLAFARHAQDPDAELRLAIADSVGLAGEVRALPTVQAMLRDRDAQVARAAERAVARLTALRPKD